MNTDWQLIKSPMYRHHMVIPLTQDQQNRLLICVNVRPSEYVLLPRDATRGFVS